MNNEDKENDISFYRSEVRALYNKCDNNKEFFQSLGKMLSDLHETQNSLMNTVTKLRNRVSYLEDELSNYAELDEEEE